MKDLDHRNWKFHELYSDGEKIPRKLKKELLGPRWSKSKIRKMIKSLKVNYRRPDQRHLAAIILPFEFCPYCGCTETFGVDHEISYPDVWIESFCLRCREKVGEADNSTFSHVLEYLYEENLEQSARRTV